MTTAKPSTTPTDTPAQGTRFRLPEPPKREPDEMTSYDHLHKHGIPRYLNQSQGGMCICRKSGVGLGVSQEGFGP